MRFNIKPAKGSVLSVNCSILSVLSNIAGLPILPNLAFIQITTRYQPKNWVEMIMV